MKIGIALGGGGARGFAHLGVLKELNVMIVKQKIVPESKDQVNPWI